MKSIRLWNRGIAFLLSASLSLTPCFSWTGEVYAAVQEEETAPAASVHNEAEYVSEAASETEAETTGEEKETLPAVYEEFETAAEEVGMEEDPDMEVADRQAAEITDKKASSSNAEFDEDGFLMDGDIVDDIATASDAESLTEEVLLEGRLLDAEPDFFFEKEVEGYHITLRARAGILQEGIEVRIEQITAIDGEEISEIISRELEHSKAVRSIAAFDISFWKDGEEVQPEEGSVSVTVRLSEEMRKDQEEAQQDSAELKVFHLEDASNIEEIPCEVNDEKGEVTYEAESFSAYCIVLTDIAYEGICGTNAVWRLDPEGVLTISGSGAVAGYPFADYKDQIKEIVVEEGITSFGATAFQNCENLHTVRLPDTITTISMSSFQGCSSIEEMVLPFAGKSRDASRFEAVFGYIFGMTKVEGSRVNGTVDLRQFVNSQTGSASGTWQYSEYEMKNSYTNSGSIISNPVLYSYYYPIPASLKKVEISDAEKIRSAAFYNCVNLQEITIEGDVTEIEEYAFANASRLLSVYLPENLDAVGAFSFNGCKSLGRLELPAGVTKLGEGAFQNCTALNLFSIPDSVTTLGSGVFSGDSSLVSVYIGSGVSSIVSNAFLNCTSLTSVELPETVRTIGKAAFSGCGALTAVDLGAGLTYIGEDAFLNCDSLRAVVIPDSVRIIEKGSFTGCSALEEITLPFVGNTRTATRYNSVFGFIFGYSVEQGTYDRNASTYRFVDLKTGSSSDVWQYSEYENKDQGSLVGYVPTLHSYYYKIPASLKKVTITDSESLPEAAFMNCSRISSISWDPELRTVKGKYTFRGNSWFASLSDEYAVINNNLLLKYNGSSGTPVIPEGVEYIAAGVFESKQITSVGLPESLEGIGSGAFNTSTLKRIKLPKNISYIADDAFLKTCLLRVYNDSYALQFAESKNYKYEIITEEQNSGSVSFDYEKKDEEITITGFRTTDTEMTIPSSIEGFPVTEIGDYAFKGLDSVITVTIPSSVRRIGKHAFQDCTNVVNVTVPTTVSLVDDYAFLNCTSLSSVTLAEGIEKLGTGIFQGCTSLEEVSVPDTVTYLGERAFYGCSNLRTLTVGLGTERIRSYTCWGCDALTQLVIGTAVQEIGDYAFYKTNLFRVSVPASVQRIGKYAFAENTGLERLTLKKTTSNLVSIDSYAFYKCSLGGSGTASLSLPESVEYLGTGAFSHCSGLTSVTVPEKVTEIPDYAFDNCTGLSQYSAAGSVTRIGICAFRNTAISSAELKECTTTLGRGAFYQCTGLTDIRIPDNMSEIGSTAFYGCTALRTVSLPDKVEFIGSSVFEGNDDLEVTVRMLDGQVAEGLLRGQRIKHAVLENGIRELGASAFEGCTELTDIRFPDTLETIGDKAFAGSPKLKEIILPDGVTSIGRKAFESAELKKLSIPDTVCVMGENALEGYNGTEVTVRFVGGKVEAGLLSGQNLRYIRVDDGITEIGENAFENSTARWISVPDTVVTVGSGFADGCTGCTFEVRSVTGNISDMLYRGSLPAVKSIVLNGEFNRIGSSCFAENENLELVFARDKIELLASGAFRECTSLKTVSFTGDVGTVGDHAFDSDTSLATVNFRASLGSIGDYGFHECLKLKDITLPDGVTSIGAYAFYNCNNLEEIHLGEGLSSIQPYTFFGCASLSAALIPDMVKTIGDYAFYGCTAVSEIKLGSGLETIGAHVFTNCNQIRGLVLPKGLSGIGDYAFRECSGINEMIIPDSVQNLGVMVFYNCTGLTVIDFGQGITSIPDRTFRGCVNLEKVILNGDVTEIDENAFFGAEDATVYDYSHEYVRNFCEDNGINYVDLGADFTAELTAPEKREYIEGEALDTTGMKLTVTYGSGITRVIENGLSVTGYDPDLIGEQVLSVEYRGNVYTFDVTVIERRAARIELEKLPEKLKYKVGEAANFTGLQVKVVFEDGGEKLLDDGYVIEGFSSAEAGIRTVSVIYRGLSAEFDIIVLKTAPVASQPVLLRKTSVSVELQPVDGCEYSRDGENWQDSNLFEGLSINTEYSFCQRFKENSEYAAGENSEALIVITEKGDISDLVISDPEDTVYTGEEIRPVIHVEGLTEHRDYEVAYEDNVNAGTARLIVCGTGDYSGEVIKTFRILKGTYDLSSISFEGKEVFWDGTAKSIEISGELPEGVTVSYTGNGQTEPGTYTVTASFSGNENYEDIADMEAVLTIIAVQAAEIRLDRTRITLTEGDTDVLIAEVLPENTYDKSVYYESSDPETVSVDNDGKLAALKKGSAGITVFASNGVKAVCEITVAERYHPVTEVRLDITETRINVGDTLALTATVLPENASNPAVIWQSSDPETAVVDENGLVTGLKGGNAVISAVSEDQGLQAECAVTVWQPVEKVQLRVPTSLVYEGETIQFGVKITPEDASNQRVFWSSADESIATVDQNGVITGVKAGNVRITVTAEDGGSSSSYGVTVMAKPVPVQGIRIDQREKTLIVGEISRLYAWVVPENATNKTIYWSSSDSTVVSVTEYGQIEAKRAGTADITAQASDGGCRIKCSVTVLQPVTGIRLNYAEKVIAAGKTTFVMATVEPSNASNKTVFWYSSDETVAVVSETGTITGMTTGTAVITAKTEDGEFTAECIVHVFTPVARISLDKTNAGIKVGEELQLNAEISPENADNKNVLWSSDHPEIAEVSAQGLVKGISPGSAVIKAVTEDGGYQAACSIKVTQPAAGIRLEPGEAVLNVWSRLTLQAEVLPENASNQNVLWSSDDESIGTCVGGRAVALKPGVFTVTAETEDGGFKASCRITVVVPVTEVRLNQTSAALTEGESITLAATVLPDDATNKNVTWKSLNPQVAEVDANGTVTAVRSGTAVITVTTEDGSKTADCVVTVNAKVYPVEGITLDRTEAVIKVGDELQLHAEVSPENASNQNVLWSSDDESIGTCVGGRAVALKPGVFTVTAETEDGGYKASCRITVVSPVTGVRLDQTRVSLTEGESVALAATVLPDDATNKALRWNSNDLSVAKVDESGKITAVKEGTAVITVQTEDGEYTASCTVTVTLPIDPVEAFIRRLYHTCLDREADTGGLNYWCGLIRSGKTKGIRLAGDFVFSKEFKEKNYCNKHFVEQIYPALMGREPDAGGLAYWTGVLDKGTTREALLNSFASSAEYKNLCAKAGFDLGEPIRDTDYDAKKGVGTKPYGPCELCGEETKVVQFAERMYTVCLGRNAEKKGLAYWSKGLYEQTITGKSILNSFFISSEMKGKNLPNKEYVCRIYKVMLDREPDEGGLNYWTGRLDSGSSPGTVIEGFIDSNEFRQICSNYGILRK